MPSREKSSRVSDLADRPVGPAAVGLFPEPEKLVARHAHAIQDTQADLYHDGDADTHTHSYRHADANRHVYTDAACDKHASDRYGHVLTRAREHYTARRRGTQPNPTTGHGATYRHRTAAYRHAAVPADRYAGTGDQHAGAAVQHPTAPGRL